MTMLTGYSACIEMLFKPETDDICARVGMAADAGFEAIEFWGRSGKPLDRLMQAVDEAGISVAGFLAEPMVALADPTSHEAFLEGLENSREFARRIGAPNLIVTTGPARPGVPRAEQQAAVVACLSRAADILAGSGVAVALEPVNVAEHKNCFLWSIRQGLDIVDQVGRPEVRLLADMFHSAVAGEDFIDTLSGRVDRIAHVHLADYPGRNEPGTGTIPWQANLDWLRANGYAGRVGLEYHPAASTKAGLGFVDGQMRPSGQAG
jgi:hydroxypyruvate isomerase